MSLSNKSFKTYRRSETVSILDLKWSHLTATFAPEPVCPHYSIFQDSCLELVFNVYLEMQTYNFFWTYSKRTKKSLIRHIRVLTGFTGCPNKMARLIPRNGHAKFDLLSTGQKGFGIIISNCGYWISMLIFQGTAALGFIRFSPWVCSADPVVVRQDRANWARYATRHLKKTAKNYRSSYLNDNCCSCDWWPCATNSFLSGWNALSMTRLMLPLLDVCFFCLREIPIASLNDRNYLNLKPATRTTSVSSNSWHIVKKM